MLWSGHFASRNVRKRYKEMLRRFRFCIRLAKLIPKKARHQNNEITNTSRMHQHAPTRVPDAARRRFSEPTHANNFKKTRDETIHACMRS